MKLTVISEVSQLGIAPADVKLVLQEPEVTRLISVGVQGPPGPGSARYEHVQSSPATQWTVNHNLGYKPSIEVLSPGGMVVIADVVHMTDNQTLINFNAPQTGTVLAR